jgi:phospholipase C
MKNAVPLTTCLVFVLVTGCSGKPLSESRSGFIPLSAAPSRADCDSDLPKAPCASARAAVPKYIKHVVILVQENRSFDNLFATYPGADGATKGRTHTGEVVPLTKAHLVDPLDIIHSWQTFVTEYDGGKMDGFDLIHYSNGDPAGLFPYQYVDPSEIQPYWAMAAQYVLADHLFERQSSGSFVGHQDLIAGGTTIGPGQSIVNDPTKQPWGCDAPANTKTSLLTSDGQLLIDKGPFPCLKYRTMRDTLNAKKVAWKYYAPPFTYRSGGYIWTAFDAIKAVRYGPEWKANVSSPSTNIFSDISNNKLAAVSWVIPDRLDSDHPGPGASGGPSWVAQVVNALGESPYWNSTAIFVTWDDWGGFYDHVKPRQLDYQGLGFRVPMLVVSPYVHRGSISHTNYEFGSILKFIERNWGLAQLGTSDKRATSVGDVFDFTKPPRKFIAIPTQHSREYFLNKRPSELPVDDE